MIIWFLLSLTAALTQSWVQTIQKWAVALSRYSKFTITFIATTLTAIILLILSYFVLGLPELKTGFWPAVLVTGILNAMTWPIMLKAYELGEFSSVYSMILLTPVFMLFTSFLFLGEIPSIWGIIGVVLTVVGLWLIIRTSHEYLPAPNFAKGNLLGMIVALIYSVTANFDKLATLYSDRIFAPAMAVTIVAAVHALYLLLKHKKLLVKTNQQNISYKNNHFKFSGFFILIILAIVLALGYVVNNSALVAGPAAYTIAIKRTGILFGVFWGWLFFHEKNVAKKLIGAVIAILGVIAILLSYKTITIIWV